MVKFTATQKIGAVPYYLNGTKGYRSFALKLGIDPKTFHYWIKCFA
ncbi:helix-turn-helix domain-containing protein [Bacillus chungangensis]|uniref:Transposase-like protein n=1 Tax=Bacillus chungangensis TaxID=587633 RepID=A0ABT9WML8_9BACI|nr:hypothetical protein [Bacillus chungangensis]MDQ0174518.1 transposase-like protein [Bacillus chungangensis]